MDVIGTHLNTILYRSNYDVIFVGWILEAGHFVFALKTDYYLSEYTMNYWRLKLLLNKNGFYLHSYVQHDDEINNFFQHDDEIKYLVVVSVMREE